MNKKIIAIIPARGGSKGIPKKNIIDFAGKPLVAWTIEDVKESKNVKDVYVSTDDKEIANIAEKYGAKIIWRPAEISGDLSPSEDALKHSADEIQSKIGGLDYIVFLQATSPLRDGQDIDNAVEKIISENADSLFSAAEIGDFYIWRRSGDLLESLNYDWRNRKRRQDFGEQFVENGSIYIFKPEVLSKFGNRLGGKIVISEMEFWKSFEVDSLEGLKFCEMIYKIKRSDKK